jgi:glutathione S-transferase
MSHRNNDLVLCIKEWQTNKVFAKKIDAAVTRTDTNFTKLNVILKNNEWLLGDQFSIAVLLGFRIFTGCI